MTHNTPNMSEQELLNDALASEKQLLHAYSTYIAEASCPNLRAEMNKIITDTQQVQFELFNAMKQKGWYNLQKAELGEVQQAVSKYQQVKNGLK